MEVNRDQRRVVAQMQSVMPERGLDETSLPIEEDVEAPFEKECVDDIKLVQYMCKMFIVFLSPGKLYLYSALCYASVRMYSSVYGC